MSEKLCLLCKEPIFWGEHGNRRYCCPDHYDLAKKERQNQRYARDRKHWQYHRSMESILAYLFKKWGSDTPIPFDELEELGFDTNVSDRKILLKSNPPIQATVVGSYCYAIINEQEVKIWKAP